MPDSDQPAASRPARAERKAVLLRLDPAVSDALARWASDEFRSTNAHIELLLRDALRRSGRLPRETGPLPRRGRPAREADDGAPQTETASERPGDA